MSLKKQYLKNHKICKVTFRLSKEEALYAKQIFLTGEFNSWNETATPMKALKKGGFVTTLDLKKDKEYQYRYFFDQMIWKNDSQADKYAYSPFGGCENSVVCI